MYIYMYWTKASIISNPHAKPKAMMYWSQTLCALFRIRIHSELQRHSGLEGELPKLYQALRTADWWASSKEIGIKTSVRIAEIGSYMLSNWVWKENASAFSATQVAAQKHCIATSTCYDSSQKLEPWQLHGLLITTTTQKEDSQSWQQDRWSGHHRT